MTADRLHPEWSNAAAIELRQNLLLKTVEVRVKGIQRHLHCVERESGAQHCEVNIWILVAGKTREADLPLFLGLGQRFGRAARPDEEIGVVRKTDSVNLPQIEVVGLESSQTLLEH